MIEASVLPPKDINHDQSIWGLATCSKMHETRHSPLRALSNVRRPFLGPEVTLTAASYRYNDGSPVTEQCMDEDDVRIGNDVWLGARAIVLPELTIGGGAVIGAGALVRNDIPATAIAVGVPARAVGCRVLLEA